MQCLVMLKSKSTRSDVRSMLSQLLKRIFAKNRFGATASTLHHIRVLLPSPK